MDSKDAEVEVALLEIAKDLLQASDDLAATDPSASAKLAHEAYEIGRDLGIVRNHLEATFMPPISSPIAKEQAANIPQDIMQQPNESRRSLQRSNSVTAAAPALQARVAEEEGDAELFRILDRQRAVVPSFADLSPTHKPSRNDKQLTFEVATPRRSGWFSWMRSRDLRHAG